jgi:CheY-like chemotaxis protein
MNAIMGFSDLIIEAKEGEKDSFAEIIHKSSAQLLMLIDDVILLSRLQSEKMRSNSIEFKPAELVTDISRMFNLPDLKKGLNITANIPARHKNTTIQSDSDKIKQILTNFASNAVKYTLKGGVKIGFDLQNGHIEFYVEDTGIGIPEQEQDLIFDAFYRGEQVISAAIRGTGLGLSIAKELVRSLGGKIGVISKPNQGSRFYFTIPAKQPAYTHHQKALPQTDHRSWTDFTILIVEDEHINYQYLEIILKDKVKKIDRAMNGKEAVELASNNNYDFILMDLKLPEMDGIEATRIIKQQFPDLPVIVQTAHALPDEKARALSAGCDKFISKPFKKADLIEIINQAIS